MTIALTACSGPSGTPSPRDAAGRRDPTADTPRAAGDEEGASTEQVLDASDAMQAQVASCVGAATEDASTICSTGSCVQNNWAEWPMPNSLADVGQGAPNASSYTVNGDGTVTDRVTGLVWQGTPPAGPYTWGGAVSYCTSLTLGGQRDWRLPTYVELVSIVDYSAGAPTIDPTAFPPVVRVDDVWTSTVFAADTTTAWEVYFFAGDSTQDPVSGSNDVRCVRGPDGVSTPAVPPEPVCDCRKRGLRHEDGAHVARARTGGDLRVGRRECLLHQLERRRRRLARADRKGASHDCRTSHEPRRPRSTARHFRRLSRAPCGLQRRLPVPRPSHGGSTSARAIRVSRTNRPYAASVALTEDQTSPRCAATTRDA